MPKKQLLTPSRGEIVQVTRDWMQEVAPGKKKIDGYSEEDLVDIALASIKSYLTLTKLIDFPLETTFQEEIKAFLPIIEEYNKRSLA